MVTDESVNERPPKQLTGIQMHTHNFEFSVPLQRQRIQATA